MQKPHSYGSFDYKVINPKIKRILKARSELDNTIQVAMPFVKATTTIGGDQLPEYLGAGNIGFTLGLHAIRKDMEYEDMYSGKDGQYPLIGYTYTAAGTNEPKYAKPPSEQATVSIQYFDQGAVLKNTSDFGRIPPPGITQAKIGRNKNGLLAYGEIDFVVPSLIQLEILHRVFLIPGCGMVLEWGQQFAPEVSPSAGEFNFEDPLTNHMFPWYDRPKLLDMLHKLAKRQIGMETILKDYVYPTDGQYMWMFGRIGNFTTKANSDGSFNCNIKIVGPSEDAWAYSTRTTVLPAVDKTNQVCEATSIEQYFVTTTPSKKNLKTLLDNVRGGVKLTAWKEHVKFFPQGNKPEPAGNEDNDNSDNKKEEPNTEQSSFADSEDAYFFTWRFFVNVVVNHEEYGIKSLFKQNLTPEQLSKISLLRPYADGPTQTPLIEKPGERWLNDPIEPYVGRNKYLRSIDPSVMIIVHETAAAEAARNLNNDRPNINKELAPKTKITNEFISVGDFKESINLAAADEPSLNLADPDRGFLSCGVWVNHKAVVQALAGSDTFLRGVVNLLERMNSATVGFWQLTLDNLEPIDTKEQQVESDNTYNYIVIDSNWRGSSEEAVKKAIEGGEDGEPGLYVFNKYARTDPKTGALVGSELIDSNVELKLPQLLFSQIATLGLVQKQDLAKAGAPGLEGEEDKKAPLISDPNEALREMFAITTLSVKSNGDQGPDLTILPYGENLTQVCSGANTQTTANTAGNSQRTAEQTTNSLKDKSKEDLEKIQKEADTYLNDPDNQCSKCGQSTAQQSAATQAQAVAASNPPKPLEPVSAKICELLTNSNERRVCDRAVKAGISDKTELAQFLGQLKHESNLAPVAENLNYSATGLKTTFKKYFPTDEKANEYARKPEKIANLVYGNRMGNGPEASGDGFKYRGRGMIQITGKENYANAGKAIGLDLVNNPDLLVTNYDAAVDSAIWFWKTRVKPRASNPADTTKVTRVINGGTNGLDDRIKKFEAFKAIFNSTAAPVTITPTPTTVPSTTPTPTPTTTPAPNQPTTKQCEECAKRSEVVRQANKQLDIVSAKDKLMREFPYLKEVFRYIEPFPDVMAARIRGDATGVEANAFGAAPGALSISAELTMPGINGIRVGELFWVDRIPTFYRAFGAFQVLSVEDTISLDGWKTQISSRFNYLGPTWKSRTAEFLTQKSTASKI